MTMNSNDPLIKNLIDFGLSEKEAKIYLALLELEIAPVQEVAKIAGINRSSAYVVLESLKKKGLASTSNEKKIQEYVATSPEALLQTADHLVKKQELIKGGISNIVPDLKAIYKGTKQKPKVRVFEGREGLINAMSLALNNKEKVIRAFSSGENILKILPDFITAWAHKRVDLDILLHGIYVDNQASRDLIQTLPKKVKIVYVSKKDHPSPVDMLIFDNTIGYLIVDKGEITTIVFENKEMSMAMKGIFDLAWKEAERAGGKVEEID